jgi:hypothetical protein
LLWYAYFLIFNLLTPFAPVHLNALKPLYSSPTHPERPCSADEAPRLNLPSLSHSPSRSFSSPIFAFSWWLELILSGAVQGK